MNKYLINFLAKRKQRIEAELLRTRSIRPSQLIRDGLAAMREFESRKNCGIRMHSWFYYDGENGCYACFGGAYALSKYIPKFLQRMFIKHCMKEIKSEEISFESTDKFVGLLEEALNKARCGYIDDMFARLGIPRYEGHPFNRLISNGEINKEEFYSDMERLATDLEQAEMGY